MIKGRESFFQNIKDISLILSITIDIYRYFIIFLLLISLTDRKYLQNFMIFYRFRVDYWLWYFATFLSLYITNTYLDFFHFKKLHNESFLDQIDYEFRITTSCLWSFLYVINNFFLTTCGVEDLNLYLLESRIQTLYQFNYSLVGINNILMMVYNSKTVSNCEMMYLFVLTYISIN